MTIHPLQQCLRSVDPVLRTGRVHKILATHIEADGPSVPLGTICRVEAVSRARSAGFQAEVIRVDRECIILSPLEDALPTFPGAVVTACMQPGSVPAGDAFLGRAVDALGRPIDRMPPLRALQRYPIRGRTVSPLDRDSPVEILETGIRAIDGLLTLGRGQRVGIFAASGVGKTSLLDQIARQVKADVTVICLVGERGREVEAMWNRDRKTQARNGATLVAATSDQSAAMRVRAAHYALALAEHWRDQGKHVLLLLDSMTRLAMALREIGLAAGEPPTVRAYTPGVFAEIPKMVERCGAVKSGGAITAVFTVLSESDEVDDPVCEMMKSLLDGHIILSRSLAEQNHFPAIDISRSVSRQAKGLVPAAHRTRSNRIMEWYSLYESSRTVLDTGLYAAGSNKDIDRAIERRPEIIRFLKQDTSERIPLASTHDALARVIGKER